MATINDTALATLIYGSTPININDNGLWNATALIKAYNETHDHNKKLNNWLRNISTEEYIKAVGDELRISVSLDKQDFGGLVEIIYGDNGSTWIHPKLVLSLAHWLSPKFHLWCNNKLSELLVQEKEDIIIEVNKQIESLIQQPKKEKSVQALLEESFNGRYGRYLKLDSGIPDLITDCMLVEIKKAEDYKHAKGQIDCYKFEMEEKGIWNNRTAIAYFFDPNNWLTEARKSMIMRLFSQSGYQVMWHVTNLTREEIQQINQVETILKTVEEKNYRYIVVDPSGHELPVHSLKKWCTENQIDYSTANKVLRGVPSKKSCKGYTFKYYSDDIKNETRSERMKQAAAKHNVVCQEVKTKKTYLINNLKAWCSNRNISSPGNIYSVIEGKRATAYGHKFWDIHQTPDDVLILLEKDPI